MSGCTALITETSFEVARPSNSPLAETESPCHPLLDRARMVTAGRAQCCSPESQQRPALSRALARRIAAANFAAIDQPALPCLRRVA
jgi:hypothetical protein